MKTGALIIGLLVLAAGLNGRDLVLRHGTVYTFDRGVLADTDLLLRDGRIFRIGKDLKTASGTEEIDLQGKAVIPGIIDSHTHIALLGGINEAAENVTPEVDMADQVNPDDPSIFYCLTGGVTMVHTMHGSANPIGGRNVTLKLKWGGSAEEMIENRATRTLKMALGENPKRAGGGKTLPSTRMGVTAVIRDALIEARAYARKRSVPARGKVRGPYPPQARNLRLEVLQQLLKGELVVRCHSYRADESLQLIRLAKEFGFTIRAFEHLHQAYRIADELAAAGIGISVFADNWNYKTEASEFTPFGMELLHRKGVVIALNSDTSEIMRRLYMEAGKMRRYAGMSDLEALKTITLNPARLLGVEGFAGSIREGFDADLAVFDGDPLSGASKCVLTIIEGRIYFNREKDSRLKESGEVKS